jgi:hypothetical protein
VGLPEEAGRVFVVARRFDALDHILSLAQAGCKAGIVTKPQLADGRS